VNLTAIPPGPVISGYTISLSPQQVSLNGAPVTATISFAPTSSAPTGAIQRQSAYVSPWKGPQHGIPRGVSSWWALSATAGAACCFLLVFPGSRKRYYLAAALGSVCLLAFAVGCGGGGASGQPIGGGTPSGGSSPVQTSISLSTSNAKVPFPQSFLITATITSTKPTTGTVTFYNYGKTVEIAPVFNGQAQTGTGYINDVGLYQITASYSGDGQNLPSQTSSSLTQVVTGSWSGTFQANTGGDVHSLQVLFGLQ
jgi:Bacterial Ig-like domain (group 3)